MHRSGEEIADQQRLDQQRLRMDEMPTAREPGGPHRVPPAVEAELELALGSGPFEQPVGEPVPGRRPYRPLLDEPGPRPPLDER
ncbi:MULTISPECIES: hypothetical protein [unclassified Streptomyces]|uniref:hypothetical protein n=1 Tax=unclassified Streptomyces TaxID=2593676 RepID=UPI00035FEE57|nr:MULTISPECIES: hypothetical protein [unclassified Streptomyces]MYT28813.1 hypothetical protein [Streptomyces sp. SID8354]